MPRLAILRKLTLQWAILAMLFGSIAPWIGAAWGHGAALDVEQVCSGVGSKWVVVADADAAPTPGQPHAHAFAHCVFCSHHVDLAALPPKVDVALPVVRMASVVPRLFLQAPKTQHAWASAQPRAPPAAT